MKPDSNLKKFRASASNSGAVTYRKGKTITLLQPDGRPVQAGDLKEGQAFTVDLDTGIIRLID